MKRYSISNKVLAVFLALTVGIVALSFVAAVIGGNYLIKDTILDYTNELVSQVENTIGDYQEGMMSIAEAILKDEYVKEYIYNGADNKQESMKMLNFAIDTRDDITNIFIIRFDENGGVDIVCDSEDKEINQYAAYRESLWYEALIEENRESIVTSSYVQNLVKNKYDWVISLGVSVLDEEGKIAGVILIDLNYSSIKNICDNVIPSNQGYIYILSHDGQIVYHPFQQLIFNNVVDEDMSIVLESNSGYIESDNKIYVVMSAMHLNKWKTVAVLDETVVYRNRIINTIIFAASGLVLILISFYLSYVFSYWFTKPIKELSHNMKKVQEGDLSVRVNIKNTDEIGDLGESFNVMTERLDLLLKRILVEQEERRNKELAALRAQINPHFLYNTLDSIIWMAECGQTEEVVDMTSALSKMLRASISKQKSNPTLKLELQNAVNYLKIQKVRYSNKLDYTIDVDKKLYNKKVVHLVLQPLVENSIYHGIKTIDRVGTIGIKAYERDGVLYIKVIDNGAGMSEEVINDVLQSNQTEGSGIGIYNVDKRIKLIYGSEYGLSIESKVNQGTTVTIKIPSIDVDVEGDDLY